MPAKPKSFLSSRTTTQPASASDEDFEAAIGIISPTAATKPVYSQNLPVSRIRPNPFQARQHFDGIEELAQVISEQGFFSRLRVRPDPTEEGYFQLVFGERRWRAAKLAGLTEIPCDIAQHSDQELIEIGLAENIQRSDLNPLEEAQAFQKFMQVGNYTIRQLAQRLGKNKDYIDGRLALLRAPEDVQKMVVQKPDTVTVARRIAQLPDEKQRSPLIRAVLEGNLNKEDIRLIVQTFQQSATIEEQIELSEALRLVRPDGQNQTGLSLKNQNVAADAVRLDGQSGNNAANSQENQINISKSRKENLSKLQNNRRLLKKVEQDKATILAILSQWQELITQLDQAGVDQVLTAISSIKETLELLAEPIEPTF